MSSYAGFSAGALAAVLASDENTRAIMALDLVDQADLGVAAIRELTTPLIGLAGPASSCNANSNGEALFSVRSEPALSRLSTISGASHCDFESPTNWLCKIACGNNADVKSEKSRRATIIKQAVESLLPHLSAPESDRASDLPKTAHSRHNCRFMNTWHAGEWV